MSKLLALALLMSTVALLGVTLATLGGVDESLTRGALVICLANTVFMRISQ